MGYSIYIVPHIEHAHHSLRYALTRTILAWSGVFFILMSIIFLLTFDDLRNYTLQKVAEYRLNYQTEEFAKHLRQKDSTSIKEESDALVQDPEIAGIVLIDSSGELVHTSLHDDRLTLHAFDHITPSALSAKVYNTPHLHLFQSNIPDSSVRLFLVLDDRPITRAIQTSTMVTGVLLLMLLLLSIFALHRVLHVQLIEPMDQLRAIMGSGEAMPDRVIQKLESSLPSEAGDILETYDQLVHAEHDMAQRFHDMLDRVPGCLWSASTDLKYTEVSAQSARIFNCTPSQTRGCELWSWLPDTQQREQNLENLQHAIAAHAPSLEFAYCIPWEGRERWFGESISLFYREDPASGDSVLDGIFGFSNDISQRKAEEAEIQSMQQQSRKMEAVGTLVGGIAHEFNNMLAGIIGNVFLLKSEIDKETKSAVRLGRIEALSNRASSLVDQLLAFGRRNRISVHNVALAPLLQQVHAIESTGLPPHTSLNLEVDDSSADGQLTVRADPSLLRRVLISLIDNAADACAEKGGGVITLGLRDAKTDKTLFSRFPQLKGKDVLCLGIQDTGSGIRDELLNRVFDPFFTTKEVGQGTGMGLSMVYGIVEGFGGAIELESEEGSGTSVHLYLQRSEAAPDEHEQPKNASSVNHGQGQTVLIADDEALLREAAQEMLFKLHYTPVAVEDGEAALHYVQEHGDKVSLVLLDLIMPVMGGAEAAEHIRRLKPKLPIVFLTGADLNDIDHRELQLPRSVTISKPYRIEHLSQVMAELLQQTGQNSV